MGRTPSIFFKLNKPNPFISPLVSPSSSSSSLIHCLSPGKLLAFVARLKSPPKNLEKVTTVSCLALKLFLLQFKNFGHLQSASYSEIFGHLRF